MPSSQNTPAPSGNLLLFKQILGSLSWTDKLLPLWIVLAMVVGVLFSEYLPASAINRLNKAEVVGVSFPLAIGLVVMMIPPLTKIEFRNVFSEKGTQNLCVKYMDQLILSFVLNWIVCPLVMLALAWACLPHEREYREGIIMIGLARCIAMVLLWNDIAMGNQELCGLIVVFNSLLQIVLYAPYQVLFVYKISNDPVTLDNANLNIAATYSKVAQSVGFFLGVPLLIGTTFRYSCVSIFGLKKYNERILPFVGPWALVGLLYTIVIIFAERGKEFVDSIGSALLCFVPLTLYFIITWFGSFFFIRWFSSLRNFQKLRASLVGEENPEQDPLICGCEKNKLDSEQKRQVKWATSCGASYEDTITQVFTASSNNFELSLALAISLYGSGSKQAIAATFGPLLEVPILLILTFVAKWFQHKFLWRDQGEN